MAGLHVREQRTEFFGTPMTLKYKGKNQFPRHIQTCRPWIKCGGGSFCKKFELGTKLMRTQVELNA
jgi:hypothetical protein